MNEILKPAIICLPLPMRFELLVYHPDVQLDLPGNVVSCSVLPRTFSPSVLGVSHGRWSGVAAGSKGSQTERGRDARVQVIVQQLCSLRRQSGILRRQVGIVQEIIPRH